MQINENKLARQRIGIGRVIANFQKGLGATLEWCTGMGKTFASFLIIKEMLVRDNTRSTIIVVPTLNLKHQWERKLKKDKIPNTQVFVVNGITINEIKLKCTLLILDEVHMYASDIFSRVYDIEYQFLLQLTATIDRLDGKHDLLIQKAPIVDTITLQEAKRNGWVSDYLEYNLGLELTEQDKERYNALHKRFVRLFAIFNHNLDTAKQCSKSKVLAEQFAIRNGLDINSTRISAINCMKAMRARKEFLYGTLAKQEVTLEILKMFPELKAITFSQACNFADEVTELINNEFQDTVSMPYHSKLKTIIVNGKKMGKVTRCKDALKKFIDNRYKVRVLNTAMALDKGSDFPDVALGVIASSTSNPTQHIQRVGRIIRDFVNKYGDRKLALIINLYIKGTQDEKWLKKRQTDPKTKRPINPNIIEISNINEIEYSIESNKLSVTE